MRRDDDGRRRPDRRIRTGRGVGAALLIAGSDRPVPTWFAVRHDAHRTDGAIERVQQPTGRAVRDQVGAALVPALSQVRAPGGSTYICDARSTS